MTEHSTLHSMRTHHQINSLILVRIEIMAMKKMPRVISLNKIYMVRSVKMRTRILNRLRCTRKMLSNDLASCNETSSTNNFKRNSSSNQSIQNNNKMLIIFFTEPIITTQSMNQLLVKPHQQTSRGIDALQRL